VCTIAQFALFFRRTTAEQRRCDGLVVCERPQGKEGRVECGRVVPVHATQVDMNRRGIAPRTLNLGTGWTCVAIFTHRLLYPLNRRLGGWVP
jgi:hypothetical protein